jgi:hypothetical protein
MKIQKESLEDLKSKDPEAYEKINAISKSVFGFIAEDNVNVRIMDSVIQGEIQRAVEKQGWNWQVQTWNTSNLKFYIAYVTGDGKEAEAQAVSPSGALLSAYLEALE